MFLPPFILNMIKCTMRNKWQVTLKIIHVIRITDRGRRCVRTISVGDQSSRGRGVYHRAMNHTNRR